MTHGNDTPPPPPVKPAGRSPFRRLSVVWIVPAIALIAVIGVALKTYVDKGPLIRIAFDNAAGIAAGETELRYRDVTVGMVEKLGFTDGLDRVMVSVRVHKDVAEFVDSEARFWVVRPQVTAQGVSGLDTVLSGVFIEGIWDSTPGGLQEEFDGLVDPPLERLNQKGLILTLRAAGDASLTQGAPVVYQGITVGQVGQTSISEDGTTAEAEAIIYAPHDQLIDSATRFWDTSGFSFSLGPNGAALDFSSIASLISGGVTFATLVSGGEPLEPGATVPIYVDEASARAAVFAGDEGETLTLSAVFEENIAGLAVDAPVEMAGLKIGRISALNGLVDPDRFGDNRVRLVASLAIQPGRLGLEEGAQDEGAALEFLSARVKEGLRARLATTSILTGGLK
ncbi:paraquat-inducible protein B, partial [Pelagivirga sediminicola]